MLECGITSSQSDAASRMLPADSPTYKLQPPPRALNVNKIISIYCTLPAVNHCGSSTEMITLHATANDRDISARITSTDSKNYYHRRPSCLSAHCKNVRISTDILTRVFHILTEPVPYTFVYAYVGPRFIIPSIYGYKRVRNLFR